MKKCSVYIHFLFFQNAMRVHMRTHTSILPYECKFCHRKFREKASLLRHVRMHTGERPFKCNRCGRAFAEHGTLNRHLKAKGRQSIHLHNTLKAIYRLKIR